MKTGKCWANFVVAPMRDHVVAMVILGGIFGVRRIERRTFFSVRAAEDWKEQELNLFRESVK